MTEVIWAPDGSDAAVVAAVAGVIAGGGTTLALPGGGTPGPILSALAALPLPWGGVTIFPGDERIVAADHPASNAGQLTALFAGTGARIVPLEAGMALPRFDLVWVGMGNDGHIASLFPNTDPDPAALPGVIRVTPDPLPPEAPFDRLTLTISALVRAEAIILVVRGEAKRTLIENAIAGANDLPVTRLLAAARTPATIYWTPA